MSAPTPTPDVAAAVKAAVAAIYFDDSSDYSSALWSVVRALSPPLAALLETNPSAAYHQADALATPTPAPAPQGEAMPPLPPYAATIHEDGYWMNNKNGPLHTTAHHLSWARKEVFTVEQMHAYVLADRLQRASQPVKSRLYTSRVDALIDALEGECDGLAVSRETAEAILHYVDGNAPPVKEGEPVAWMCEFMREDETTDTQVVLEDPECTRWADAADGDGVSPYKVTPLYTSPPQEEAVAHARYEYIRKLTPRQFTDLWTRNINGEGPFDDLVDRARSIVEGEK